GPERSPRVDAELRGGDLRLERLYGTRLERDDLVDHVAPLDAARQAAEGCYVAECHGASGCEASPEPMLRLRAHDVNRVANRDYWSRRSTSCGAALACASIATPACWRIWFLVNS